MLVSRVPCCIFLIFDVAFRAMPLTAANRVDYNLLLSVALMIVLRHGGVTDPCVDSDDPSTKYGSKRTCCLENYFRTVVAKRIKHV